MKKVKLPIYWYSEEDGLLADLGIDKKREEDADEFDGAVFRELVFYNINAIYKYLDKEEHTVILSNGEKFICPWPINKVEKLIDDANT